VKRYYTPDIVFGPVSEDEEVHSVYKASEVQVLLRAVADEVKGMEHDEECYGGACVICAGREPAHPCGMYFGDNTNHDFVAMPCNCRRGEALRLLGEVL
jgi:hypothetical protein